MRRQARRRGARKPLPRHRDAFTHRLNSTYPSYYKRVARGVVWLTGKRIGVLPGASRRWSTLAGSRRIPVLLTTGTDDPHAPPEDLEKLHTRCPGNAELWLVPGAGHRDLFDRAGATYEEKVIGFLERSLTRRQAS